MNAWTTRNKLHRDRYQNAQHILETIISPFSISIIEYMQEHASASFSELVLSTSMDAAALDEQLEQMCETGILNRIDEFFGQRFALNYEKLKAISRVGGELARMYQEEDVIM